MSAMQISVKVRETGERQKRRWIVLKRQNKFNHNYTTMQSTSYYPRYQAFSCTTKRKLERTSMWMCLVYIRKCR